MEGNWQADHHHGDRKEEDDTACVREQDDLRKIPCDQRRRREETDGEEGWRLRYQLNGVCGFCTKPPCTLKPPTLVRCQPEGIMWSTAIRMFLDLSQRICLPYVKSGIDVSKVYIVFVETFGTHCRSCTRCTNCTFARHRVGPQ